MKKKLIIAFIAVVVLGAGGWMGHGKYQEYQKEAEKKRMWEEGTRPFNTLTKIRAAMNPVTGEPTNYNKTTLVMFFNSECDHCQQEADELAAHFDQLKETQLWFISFEEQNQAHNFLKSKKLTDHSDFHLFITTPEEAKALFGVTWLPQTFIYEENRLVTGFLGPAKFAEKIAPYL